MKKRLLRWGLSLLSAAGIVLLYLWLNSYSHTMELIERYKSLANAFTAAGIALLCVGAMVWVSTTGFFDGIGYVLQHAGKMLLPGNFGAEKKYMDYKEAQQEKRKESPVLHLFTVGLVCMAISVLFIVRFYGLYTG